MSVYIGFSTPKNFKVGAEAIKLWQQRPYSHVYIRFESLKSGIPSTVYHAAHGMVHFITQQNFLKTNDVVKEYEILVSPEQRREILIHCMNIAGENYSTIELVQIVMADVWYTLTKSQAVFIDSKGYICSELVGKIGVSCLGWQFDMPLSLLKPVDIDNYLRKQILIGDISGQA